MARIGQINPRRVFISNGRKNVIAKACQTTLENLEDRRLLSSVVAGLDSAHERHVAHMHHVTHMRHTAGSGVEAASSAAPAASAPIGAPLPASPLSVIQPGVDASSVPYLGFRAVDGIVTDTNADGFTWTVRTGAAADGLDINNVPTFPSAGSGTPVLQAVRNDGLQTNGNGLITYSIHFNAPGSYKLYVRDKYSPLGGSLDNSMFVPPSSGATSANPTQTYDNDALGSDGRVGGAYTWDLTAGTATYNVAAAGDTTISFSMRENNYIIDRVVLSQNTNLSAANLDALVNTPITVGAPQTLTATSSGLDVNLSWGLTPGADAYNIKRSSVPGGPYTTVQTGVLGTTGTDTVLATGTYYYVVSASKGGVEGNGNSPEFAMNVTGQLAPPTGLTAVNGLTNVTINWVAPTGGATGYDVKRGTSAAGPFTTIASNVPGTSYADSTGTSGTTYFYVVSALKTGSPASNNSAPVSGYKAFVGTGDGWGAQYYADNIAAAGTPQFGRIEPVINVNSGYAEPNGPGQIAGLGVPSTFNTGFSHTPGANFSIRWDGVVTAQFNEQYTFYAASDDGIEVTVDGTIIDNNLGARRGVAEDTSVVPATWVAGSKHNVTVRFVEAGGGWGYYLKWSSPSTPKDFVPQSQVQAAIPATGPTLSAVPNSGQVVLSWTPQGVSSYSVLRSTTGAAGSYAPIASNLTTTTYTDSTVTNGTTYFYEITGSVQLGASPPSNVVSVTPTPQPPQQVTGLAAVPGANQVILTWGATTFATSYNVLRGPVGGPYTQIKSGVLGTTFTDTTAVHGQSYGYEVSASNASGTGPVSAPVNADLTNGVTIHYYDDQWWKSAQGDTTGYLQPSLTGFESSAIFPSDSVTYGTDSSPIPGIKADNWSDIITGTLTVSAADVQNASNPAILDPIVFANSSDDDGYLFIDGKLVASDPGGHGTRVSYLHTPADGANGAAAGTTRVPITLTPGVHSFVHYHSEGGGGAGQSMQWILHYDAGLAQTPVIVPASKFTAQAPAPLQPTDFTANGAAGTGVVITYFDNSTNEIAYIVQRSTTPNFAPGTVQNIYRPWHDNSDDNDITYTDAGNLGAQQTYYRVVAANFDAQTATPIISVPAFLPTLPNPPLPGVEAHFYNDEWWRSGDQSTGAPGTRGALTPADADTTLTNIDNTFGAATAGPVPGIRGINFSTVLTGKIHINTAGSYKFNIRTDDDSYFYIDGNLASASPGGHGINDAPIQNAVTLTAGDHNIVMFQSQGGGGWGYQLDYTGPDTDTGGGPVQTIVPSSAFVNEVSDPVIAPGALSFTGVASGAVTINWADTNNSEIRYIVERSTDNFATNATVVGTTGINGTKFTDFTVTPGTAYTYRVHAENFDYFGPAVTGATTTLAVATGGSLSGTQAASPTVVDLAALGTIDWAHWGFNSPTSFDHSSTATEHISDVTGSGNKLQFGNNPVGFTWTNGTPNGTVNGSTTGIYNDRGPNKGFEFTVPAATTTRRLYVYVGAFSATGQLSAHLSDGSSVPFLSTALDAPTGTTANAVYTIDFKAASAGQVLIVDWTESAEHANGNLTLEGAALAGTGDFIQPTGFVAVQAGVNAKVTFTNNTPTATSIVVQRSTDPNFGVGTITTFTLAGTASSFFDNGPFTVGTKYYYRAQAVGLTTTPFSSAGSFTYLPVGNPIDHSTGFIPVVGGSNLLTDGTFETPVVPAASFNYNPTGGAWAFSGTSGIIAPPSAFGGAAAAQDGFQYAFLQNNSADAHSSPTGQTITETVGGFVAGHQYVFTVFDAARPGNTPHYQVLLDPGTPNQKLIYTGNPTNQAFTQEYSAAFTTTAGSHVVQFVATGTNDNTTYLDQAQIVDYVSGSSASDLTLNGGSSITVDGRVELSSGANNQTRSVYETTGVPLTGDFTTTFDFQFSGAVAADGITFALQSNNPNAIGGGGGGLAIQGINNSVAVQFNMYNNVTQTGIIINGAGPGVNRIDLTTGVLGNAFHNGNPTDIFHVTLSYNYATKTLTETLLDTGSSSTGGTGTNQIVQNYNVDIPAILGNPGGNSFAYVGFTGATGGASSVQDILNWKFQGAPVATSNSFLFQSGPRKISMKFNENVSASLSATDLVVHNITTNADVTSGVLSYDAATNTATWTFATLPDGNYHATLAAGSINDNANLLLSNNTSLDFFWLNGDADRDRAVGFSDLVAVAQHYNQVGGGTLATGDLDGDGDVGFSDLVAVAQNYNHTLPALPGAPVAAGAVSSPAEQAAVVASLPDGPAKSFVESFLSTQVAKPVAKPVVTPVAKPVTTPVKVTSKPVVVSKPTFSTTRIATVKKKGDLLN